MLSPVTHALIKIFARGFFRVNSGLLVFLFVMLISYCFFMNTAGDVNLISAEQLTFYHFIIVITFVSSPIMTLIIFVIWLMYTIKAGCMLSGNYQSLSINFYFTVLHQLIKQSNLRAGSVFNYLFLYLF